MPFRAFVGVPVPAEPPLVALLDGLAATGADLKVVDPAQLHVTLSFLGQVPDEAAPRIAAALDEAARPFAPFKLRLQGVGAFPSARRPRVVWAGSKDAEPLVKLANATRDTLRAAGFAGDDKDFRAHVTLARTRSEARIAGAVAFLRDHGRDELPEVPVRDVRLYRSVLSPGGPAYEVVHAAALGGA